MDMGAVSAMSAQTLAISYDMAMLKKTMENIASQEIAMIDDLAQMAPPPSEYNFDVYG